MQIYYIDIKIKNIFSAKKWILFLKLNFEFKSDLSVEIKFLILNVEFKLDLNIMDVPDVF